MRDPGERARRTLVHEVKNVLTAIKVEAQRTGRNRTLRPDIMMFFVDQVARAVALLDEFLNVRSTDPMYESSAGKNSRSLTVFRGPYINLSFQDGPIKEQGVNGTTNEEVINLLIDRLESLDKIMESKYNRAAIDFLKMANGALEQRTIDRDQRGVEGTNAP